MFVELLTICALPGDAFFIVNVIQHMFEVFLSVSAFELLEAYTPCRKIRLLRLASTTTKPVKLITPHMRKARAENVKSNICIHESTIGKIHAAQSRPGGPVEEQWEG